MAYESAKLQAGRAALLRQTEKQAGMFVFAMQAKRLHLMDLSDSMKAGLLQRPTGVRKSISGASPA